MTFYEESADNVRMDLNAWYMAIEEGKKLFKKDKIYFAAPWFSEKTKVIYDYVVNMAKLYNYEDDIIFPREMGKGKPESLFKKDLDAIKGCDFVLAFISEWDMGTAFEIGYAYALYKPIVYLIYNENDLQSKTNLMLAQCANLCINIKNLDCLFNRHLGGTQRINIPEDSIE